MSKPLTVYNTPVVIHFLRLLADILLFIMRWKADTRGIPKSGNFLILAAPHTSNWDFVIGLSLALKLRINANWVGKSSLFTGPAGPIMRWLGGIPLDRSKANNLVDTSIQLLKSDDEHIVAIAPEGTRSWTPRWKTGFYHIASGANVPIALAYFDYKKRIGGVAITIKPSSDKNADLHKIQDFYAIVAPKYLDKYNPDIIGNKPS